MGFQWRYKPQKTPPFFKLQYEVLPSGEFFGQALTSTLTFDTPICFDLRFPLSSTDIHLQCCRSKIIVISDTCTPLIPVAKISKCQWQKGLKKTWQDLKEIKLDVQNGKYNQQHKYFSFSHGSYLKDYDFQIFSNIRKREMIRNQERVTNL